MLQDGSSWRQPMCRRPALPDDISEGPITKNLLLDAQQGSGVEGRGHSKVV